MTFYLLHDKGNKVKEGDSVMICYDGHNNIKGTITLLPFLTLTITP